MILVFHRGGRTELQLPNDFRRFHVEILEPHENFENVRSLWREWLVFDRRVRGVGRGRLPP